MAKALIFIHGWASNRHKLDCIKTLVNSHGYDYINFDLPLHGEFKNTTYDKELTFDELADYSIEYINKLDYDEVILLGHSMGGGIILLNYERIKLNIKKIILLDPLNQHMGTNNKEQFKEALEQSTRLEPPSLTKMLTGRSVANTVNLLSLVKSFNHVDFKSKFVEIDLDTKIEWYIVYGVNDLIINGAATSMWLMALNNSIKIYPIENARHNPFSDNEQECLKALERILND